MAKAAGRHSVLNSRGIAHPGKEGIPSQKMPEFAVAKAAGRPSVLNGRGAALPGKLAIPDQRMT